MTQSPSSVPSPGQAGLPAPVGSFPQGGVSPVPAVSRPAQQALAALEAQARELEGQPEALLGLLRSLEQLHRTIQDGPFRSSLPADRNALFRLLSEMERSGGWPYIPRLQLRTFLDLLGQGGSGEALPQAGDSPDQDHGDGPRLAA